MNLQTIADKYPAGLRVIITKNEGTRGMLIADRHLAVRCIGKTGFVRRYVPGHGGDVWFVDHEDGSGIGAYSFTEFEECPSFQETED